MGKNFNLFASRGQSGIKSVFPPMNMLADPNHGFGFQTLNIFLFVELLLPIKFKPN